MHYPHPIDDQGYPLNPSCCEVCKQNSITMNAISVARLFKQITREGTDERLEREERQQDYQDDGGAKFNG